MKSETYKKVREALVCANLNLTTQSGHAKMRRELAVATIAQAFSALASDEIDETEEMRRGLMLCEVLNIRRDSTERERYATLWGTKTALGIFRTVKRIIDEGK